MILVYIQSLIDNKTADLCAVSTRSGAISCFGILLKEASYIIPTLDGYTTDDITYLWEEIDPVQLAKGLNLPRYKPVKYSSAEYTVHIRVSNIRLAFIHIFKMQCMPTHTHVNLCTETAINFDCAFYLYTINIYLYKWLYFHFFCSSNS